MFKNRRAQITVFIIIGVIVLFATALVFYTRVRLSEYRGAAEPVLETAPVEFQPLQSYITNCVEDVAIEGLDEIGRVGGYTDTSTISTLNHCEGLPCKDWHVAYWLYLDSPNSCRGDCEFGSEKPALREKDEAEEGKSIETQLENYVNSKLKACLNNFASFKRQGISIEELGNVKTTVTIAEEDIRVAVDYPIEARKDNRKTKLTRFYRKIPLNLKRIYEQAEAVLETEKRNSSLEAYIIDQVSYFSGVDPEKLPPVDESVIGFGSSNVYWVEFAVKEKLQQMLMSYTRGIQVPGSRNYRFREINDEISSALYNQHMNFPLQGNPNLDVNFEYLNWPIYLETGSEGGIIKGESVSTFFPVPLTVTRYETAYDINAPFEVLIHDPSALNNRGYDFRFAVETCIRNAEPCTKNVFIEAPSITATSMLCDIEQRTSEEITFGAVDPLGNPLEEVAVTYTCVDETCNLGLTNENGLLKAKVPPCAGAVVGFRKPNYLGVTKTQATPIIVIQEGSGHNQITASLEPYVEMEIDVKKLVKTKFVDQRLLFLFGKWLDELSEPKELDADEIGLITMERIQPDIEGTIEDEFIPAVAQFDSSGKVKLKLVPGDYIVEIRLMRADDLVVPPNSRKAGPFYRRVQYWLPGPEPMVLNKGGNQFPSGGVVLDETTGYLHISRDDVNKNMTVYAISHNLFEVWDFLKDKNLVCNGINCPIVIEDLEIILDVEKMSKDYSSRIRPVFS